MDDLKMAKKIATKVAEKGGRTFFVGGYVRDKILGKENKDIDIEIHNISPKVLREILSNLGNITEMGASFGILGLKGFDIDIAQPRSEKATGRGHKDFEVFVDPFIGFESAAKRRDFTINALMEDVLTGEILDYFGGLEDLKYGIIKHVNNETFVEDPLRVLRAAQFAARFEFTVAKETVELAKSMDLSTLAKERIFGELEKALLKANKPSIFFEEMRKMEQLDIWFPEVKDLINTPQNLQYHPEGDVWNHTMMVIDEGAKLRKDSSNPLHFMLATVCHDFGKPIATKEINGVIRALEHEKLGVPIAETFLSRITNEVKIHKYVLNMVEMHMKPHYACTNKSKKKSTNKMFDESICPIDLILLSKADGMGRENEEIKNGRDIETEFLLERLEWYNNTISQPSVKGKDLLEAGLKPCKEFSELIAMGHKLQLSNLDKESALKQILAEARKMGLLL